MIEIKRLRASEKTPNNSTSKKGPYEQCVLMIIIGMIIITAIHLFTCTNTHIQTALLPLATLTEHTHLNT